MSVKIETFIKEYSKAVAEGNAAVFAGAGLSQTSGYVNWKELMKPYAEDIGLDIEREHDLISIAQYYYNKHKTRNNLNQAILENFTKNVSENSNLNILTRLPISTYWTTNYDELIEDGLKENCRKPDIKIEQESLANNLYDRDAVVYKMHGDVRNPAKAVLIKDDYETYNNNRPLFTAALQGDLISKTFLFIGFSFEDPNLDYILSRIRVLLGKSQREHYCFFEKIKNNGNEAEFNYNTEKQKLRIEDLQRYGIQAVMLNDYKAITQILKNIEKNYKLKNIFISGSISVYDDCWTEEKVNYFTHNLSKNLVKKDFKIISGFGLGIGSNIINGALEEIMSSKYKHIDEYLCLRPFPQFATSDYDLKKLWHNYRVNMIQEAGVVIFIYGNKKVDDKFVDADGMIKEFEIAKSHNKIVVPIGSTGYASKKIFEEIKQNIESYPYLEPYITKLETETDIEKLLFIIIELITVINKTVYLN